MSLAVAAGLRSYRLDVSRRFLITFGANHTDPPGPTARLQKHELPNLGRSPLSAHITPQTRMIIRLQYTEGVLQPASV
jgi:hypothetical protein